MAGKASDDAERVAVEQPAADEAVSNALGHVNQIVENIAKAIGLSAAAPAAAPVAATAPAPAAAPAVAEEGVEKAMTIKDLMKAAGIEMNAETEKKMKAAGFDPSQKFPTAKPPVEKTSKAVESADDAPVTMSGFFDLITKAKKFTPGRVEALKGAVVALKALLDEIEEVPQGTMPGVSPGGSTQFGASGVKGLTNGTDVSKAAAPSEVSRILESVNQLATVVKSLQEGQAALKGEVEAVSKARPASESLEGAGGTESKVSKSALWSGIL